MAKGNLTLRKDSELKAQASELFKALGFDLSNATSIFYRQALKCHGLPFEVNTDEPNETTCKAMESAKNNEDIYGTFDSVKDLMSNLF